MAGFGTVLSPEIAPEKVALRNVLARYFGNPTMTKVPSSPGGVATYAAEARFQLGGGPRVLYVMTAGDRNTPGTKFPLADLEWEMLQTRLLSDESERPPCDQFSYVPKNGHPYSTELVAEDRSEDAVEYSSPLGLRVALLVKEGGSMYDYPPRGTLGAALETYQTLVRLPTRPRAGPPGTEA